MNRGRKLASWGRIGLAGLALALLALANGDGAPRRAFAANMVVTTLADSTTTDGQCSLREAMTNAINAVQTFPDCPAGGNSDVITFGVSGTIVLGSQLPSVVGNAFFQNALEIDGAGQNITISGNNAVRHFDVAVVSRLTLKNLTLSNGRLAALSSIARGGSITNAGTLIVRNSTFSGNTATTSFSSGVASAGAIAADGNSVTEVYNSTFTNNTATATNGLALSSSGGAISIVGSGVPGSSLIVDSSTFNGNSTTGGSAVGGAIAISTGAFTVDIINSTFSGNTANSNGLVSAGGGGAINMSAGVVEILHSTLSGNAATGGGAGGGIRQTGGVATLYSSVLANAGPAATPECSGTIGTSVGPIVSLAQAAVPGCVLAGAITGVSAGLGPLANNGGPTQTHALLPGSPALNVASALVCSSAQVNNKDQRGFSRPAGPGCDLGAFELNGAPPVIGGKNLTITTGSIDLAWDGGNVQHDYVLLKYNTSTAVLNQIDLPGNATSFNDAATSNGIIYCYAVIPEDSNNQALGLSDLLCAMTNPPLGTVLPVGFDLALNQSANATMTWSAPVGGADSYLLQRIPLDGSGASTVPLAGGATSTVQAVVPAGTCFQLIAFKGSAFGVTNLLCGIPGISTLSVQRSVADALQSLATVLPAPDSTAVALPSPLP